MVTSDYYCPGHRNRLSVNLLKSLLENRWTKTAPQNSSVSGEIWGVEAQMPNLFAVAI